MTSLFLVHRYCIQCGIISLFTAIQCPYSREIIVRDGFLDYLVALPWMYPSNWAERKDAQRLVTFFKEKVQLQPPALINLTNSRLASMYFGLKKVLNTDSIHELFSEVYT